MYDYLAKIILLGPSGCGKCVGGQERMYGLRKRTIGVEFSSKIIKIGTGAGRKRIKLQLWDTAGTERFRSVSRSYYRGAAGAILVYDLSSHDSFLGLSTFLDDARALASPDLTVLLAGNKLDLTTQSPESRSAVDTAPFTSSSTSSRQSTGPSILADAGGPKKRKGSFSPSSASFGAGTHQTVTTTTNQGRQVAQAEAARWASGSAIPVAKEVSAYTGEGVEELFAQLARVILTKIELGEIDPDDPLSGIQYGDSGGWMDDGSIESGTTFDGGGARRKRNQGRTTSEVEEVAAAMEAKGDTCVLKPAAESKHPLEETALLLINVPIQHGWKFKQAGIPEAPWKSVSRFPTNVHLDLIHHGIIPDPYIGKNEQAVQWIGERQWVYKTTFTPPTILPKRKAVIAFDGLDTHATVLLNGKEILKIDDMFIPQRVDVTTSLYFVSENELEIVFESTYLVGKKLVEIDPSHKYGCWNGDPSRLAVRKAQYQYGWDWGPALLTCGPWRPISLEIYTSRLADLSLTTEVDKSLMRAEIVPKCEIEGVATNVKFEVTLRDRVVAAESVEVIDGYASVTFRAQKPELWYPARYGNQPMYTVRASLYCGSKLCDTESKRFGLRRAEVVQRKLQDGPGTTFFFQINNIPIFCGGSNWIPTDMFIPRIDSSRYRAWVKIAAEGNQSMIRVWGGGIFEEQAFYDACDEMGLLVWQDFMFACGNYPVRDCFLDLVKREATINVKRLRHHPCIVIWAGNNEDYQYRETENLQYDPKDTDPDKWLKTDFPARYIYEKVLADVTGELVPSTYYHFGSPFGGKSTRDPTIGDIHQWNVWHGTQEQYQSWDRLGGRFVSEFGMAAFPSVRTIDSYLPLGPDDPERYVQSSTIDHHNKAAGGERRLATYLVENIPYSHSPLEYYVYCTQLMQAECLATAYRSWKREWKGSGREYCGGALVWQLNDCWQTQSWSIVDYYLRPKLAYYAIKRELADITVSMKRVVEEIPADKYTRVFIERIHKVQFFGTNLSLQSRKYFFQIHVWDIITGKVELDNAYHKRFEFPSNQSTEFCEFEIGDDERAAHIVTVARLIDSKDGRVVARSVNWPEPLKHIPFPQPKNLRVEIVENAKDGSSSIEVESDCLVKGFALEADNDDVVVEDNCIDLVPGEKLRIGVKGLKVGEEHRLTTRYLKAGNDL
ncbi:MAG: hypothetical protein Q9218_002958 [Villophora microphyllina]